jgi:hypothetical protein
MKRILALLLCVIMCIPLFVACGPNDDPADTTAAGATSGQSAQNTQPSVTTGDEKTDDTPDETTEPDHGWEDVEKKNWDGYQFKVLYQEYMMEDFACDEPNGDAWNDSVYARNKMVEQALNIELDVEPVQGYAFQGIVDSMAAAGWTEEDYNYVASHTRAALSYATNGTIADLGSYDEINIYRSYWEQALVDEVLIDDSIYALMGEISVYDQTGTTVVTFNKDLFSQRGYEEPYDLVRTYDWTVDRLLGYMEGFAKDYDGNGYEAEEDLFTITGWYYDAPNGIFYGSGFKFCQNDGETIVLDYDKDFLSDAIDACLSVWARNGAYYSYTTPGATHEGTYKIFSDGRALFAEIPISKIRMFFTEMEQDYGILVEPMLYDDQDRYYSYLFYTVPMLMVPVHDPNAERTGNIIESLCAASSDVVIPKVFEIVTKLQNTRDEDSSEMLELSLESKIIDSAAWFAIPGITDIANIMVTERQNIISSYLKMVEKKAQRELNNILTGYEKLKK